MYMYRQVRLRIGGPGVALADLELLRKTCESS